MHERDINLQAGLLKALGHPSRLRMALALVQGETCVCELQRLVGSDMSTVSRHLAVMRSAGLLQSRKEGLWVYSRLEPEALRRLQDCLETLLGDGEAVPSPGRLDRCR